MQNKRKYQIYRLLTALMLLLLIAACSGNTGGTPFAATEKSAGITKQDALLDYITQLIKLNTADFNAGHIESINVQFTSELPLVMYDGVNEKTDSILVALTESTNTIPAELNILLPAKWSAQLKVGDVVGRFGKPDTYPKDFPQPLDPLPLRFTKIHQHTELRIHSGPDQSDSAHVRSVTIVKQL